MDKVDFEYKINHKAYNESFARHLLERVYEPDLFSASVLDRPDICDYQHSHGIEVTTLADTYRNTLNRYKRIWANKRMPLELIVKNQPSLLEGKLGINKHGNIILLSTNEGRRTVSKSQRGLATTVALKLKKLQGYTYFKKTDLFIYAPNLHGACTPATIKEAICDLEKFSGFNTDKYTKIYDNILVYTYSKIIVVSLKEKKFVKTILVNDKDREYADYYATIAQEEDDIKTGRKATSEPERE